MKHKIALGSTNKHKLAAVEEACRRLGIEAEIVGYKADSGQNEQPVGFEETLTGAQTRARGAQQQHVGHVCIGIESGIMRVARAEVTVDLAVIALVTPLGDWYISTSPGIRFPEECVEEAEEFGFAKTTAGSMIAKRHGGDGTDPHFTLTSGRVSRMETLVEGIRLALAQFLF